MNSLIGLALAFSTANAFTPARSFVSSQRYTTSIKNTIDGTETDNEFVPMNNMLLVKKGEIIDKTEGGIILTGKAKIDKSEGRIVSTGPGRISYESGFQYPMPASVDEGVVYAKFTGEEIQYNGATHAVIADDDILVKYPAGQDLTLENAEVLWDNILVRVEVEEESESTGGILLSQTLKKNSVSSVGEVMKAGSGRYVFSGIMKEAEVKVGDMIKYRDFAAQEIEIEGEEFAVLQMTDVLVKF